MESVSIRRFECARLSYRICEIMISNRTRSDTESALLGCAAPAARNRRAARRRSSCRVCGCSWVVWDFRLVLALGQLGLLIWMPLDLLVARTLCMGSFNRRARFVMLCGLYLKTSDPCKSYNATTAGQKTRRRRL